MWTKAAKYQFDWVVICQIWLRHNELGRQSTSWTVVSAMAGCEGIALNEFMLMGCALVWRWRDIVANWRWHCQSFHPLPLSSECHSTATLNFWLHPDLMVLSTEHRPCCLPASTLPCWSLPPALSLFSSVVSPTAEAKCGLSGMDRSGAEKKRRRWIYLYWTLGKNHSVKYATERAVLSLRVLQHGCL